MSSSSEDSTIIASINVNGVRAAVKQRSESNLGLLHWLANTSADIVCLQEVRADPDQTFKALAPAIAEGWHVNVAQSHIKGRNGVAILSRKEPLHIYRGFSSYPGLDPIPGAEEFDDHGRYLELQFETLHIGSLYLPSGEANTPRQEEKYRFCAAFVQYLHRRAKNIADNQHLLVVGDWNIAHTPFDIKNARGNVKNSGFLPEERQWLTEVLDQHVGLTDVTRFLYPETHGPYTWWSARGQAFDRDTGWRIDYHIASKDLATKATRSWVEKAEAYDQRWSDHAPLLAQYSISV